MPVSIWMKLSRLAEIHLLFPLWVMEPHCVNGRQRGIILLCCLTKTMFVLESAQKLMFDFFYVTQGRECSLSCIFIPFLWVK